MTMPSNAQLKTQIDAILKRMENVEARMKTQEESTRNNTDLLVELDKQMKAAANIGRWILGVVTTLGTGAIITYLGHILANWH